MPDKDPAAMFDAAENHAAENHAAEDHADRRARAARIRQRSLELIEALGADHPLVTEALARADALDSATTERGSSRVPVRGVERSDAIDLRSSADLSH